MQFKLVRTNLITGLLRLHARYLSNLSATFFSQAVSALSMLILTPQFLKNLGVEQFSRYGVVLNLIIFSSVFDFGLNTGLLRRLIHDQDNRIKLINAVFFFFCGILLLSIPLFFYLFSIGYIKAGPQTLLYSFLIAWIVCQNMMAVFFDAIIQSANKIYISKVIRIIRTSIEFSLLFFICKYGQILYLLSTTVIVNLFYLLALFVYSKKLLQYKISFHNFRFSILKDHLIYSFWYFQNMAASVLVYNAQIILISNLTDSINVAKYLVVARFFEVVSTSLNNFTLILFPSLSKLQADGNWNHLRLMYLRMMLRVSILTLIAILFVLSFGKQLFIMWSKYNDTTTLQLFQLYSVFIALMIIENVPNIFIMALKINKWPSIVSTIQGLFGLLFCYILIPHFGITGSIFAMLAAFVLTNCFFNPIYLWTKIKAQCL